ncbi:MAG: MATE family efflux transporter [Spirochaetales bacterium]|nr:MATE family efflux transporter [Spirochaetales bacterium]
MEHIKTHATDRLGTQSIGKLLFDFSVPAIIGMLVNAFYNIVDRIYVGQGVDPLGIAGITMAMPVMLILMAASMLIGVGSNALFSIRLGEGRRDEVEKIMGHAFVLLFLVPIVFIGASFIFIDEILRDLIGASPDVFPYAKTYLRIILYGGVFSAMGPGINHFIRSDGHPRTSMLTQILGAVINIILDPIFIFVFDMGIAGAAWATIISQFVSFVWVMLYFNSRWTALRFRLRAMKLGLKLSLRIMAIGFAPFAMQSAIGIVNGVLNQSLARYGGDLAVTAMGIVFSIHIVLIMPLQGLNQGVQPIIGYNYGAKNFARVKRAYFLAVKSATIFVVSGFILLEAFPGLFIAAFRNEEGPLMELGIRVLRIVSIGLPVVGFQIITSNFFQSIGKAVEGTLLSLSRQILFFIPIVLILPRFIGLDGVFFTFSLSDFCAATISAIVMYGEWKKLGRLQNAGVEKQKP